MAADPPADGPRAAGPPAGEATADGPPAGEATADGPPAGEAPVRTLILPLALRDEVVAACLDGYPLEVCGLLGGHEVAGGVTAVTFNHPAHNAAASSRIYTVEPRDLLRAGRKADEEGVDLVGVWHSHTHTDAYPSPTDISQAPDPSWHYVVISLRDTEAVLRSYRIDDGRTEEERVVLQ